MKIKISKSIFFGASALIILLSFQNCNQSYRFNQASEEESVDPAVSEEVVQASTGASEDTLPPTENVPQETHPQQSVPVTQAPQSTVNCFPSGYTFGTGSVQKFIYYRKCDNEIQLWRNQGQQQCCSKSVTITDVNAFSDDYCSSLGSSDIYRYEGTMVCN